MAATDDVRVLEMVDDGGGGDDLGCRGDADELVRSSPRKRHRRDDGAAAARRAATQERRAAAKIEKEAVAVQKRAERTRMQVRAQALKLGRKMHAALARGAATTSAALSGAAKEEAGGGGLVLAPIVSRPNGDLESGGDLGQFVQSFQTLQQITNSSAQRQQALPPPPPPSSSYSSATLLPGTPVRLPGIPVPPIMQQQQQQQYSEPRYDDGGAQQQQILPPPPSYGALRGGALPTYREFVAQQENRPPPPPRRTRAELELELTEDQRREQARLERELQELAVTQQYENLTRLYNTLPELRRKPIAISGTRRASLAGSGISSGALLLSRSVPQQRRTVRRVFHVGRTDKELSLLTHSAATRAGVDDFRMHVQSLSTDKMRRALMAAKLLRAGSEAPEPLVRRIFQERQMLVGDLLVVNNGTGSSSSSIGDDGAVVVASAAS